MWGFWVLIILCLLLFFSVPAYPYNRDWGYWPGGILLAALILWLILLYFGAIALWWPGAPPLRP
jgi:hypothetical protein